MSEFAFGRQTKQRYKLHHRSSYERNFITRGLTVFGLQLSKDTRKQFQRNWFIYAAGDNLLGENINLTKNKNNSPAVQ